MNAQTKIDAAKPTGLALLRVPFPDNQISKLPKETRAQIDARKANKNLMAWNCRVCGGHHHKDAVHLDYVGHAAATDRLLDADPRWTWEPVADPMSLGLPTMPGGMWIKLTVDGVSRYGFGHADGKTGGDAIKEIIGDAIRNAGMRFGMALDLWHKGGDLHADDGEEAFQAEAAKPATKAKPTDPKAQQGQMPDAAFAKLQQLLSATSTAPAILCEHYKVENIGLLTKAQYDDAVGRLQDDLARLARKQTNSQFDADQLAGADL